ncbi:MAG: hypothetical protein GW802_33100, partial [Armatimonadetes bacterium]|nr:hypothetical protein [Armatimonadota bacterium]
MPGLHSSLVCPGTAAVLLACACSVLLGDPANVRDLGAKGDGTANDTSAFVAALKSSRDVYVPAGTYLVEGFALPDDTYLHGAGNASRVVRQSRDATSRLATAVGSPTSISPPGRRARKRERVPQ